MSWQGCLRKDHHHQHHHHDRDLVLGSSELLCIGEVVDGDGEEHVEQGVVAKQGQHDEVEAGENGDDDDKNDKDDDRDNDDF